MVRRHYPLASLDSHVGVYAPSIFAKKCGLRLVYTLNLAKKRLYERTSEWVEALYKTCNIVN